MKGDPMDQIQHPEPPEKGVSTTVPAPLRAIQERVYACIQCGTCTGSCPNAFAMDYTPRAMWRLVLMGEKETLFNSRTFLLCSACYYCTLRCPRGLPLTETMEELKQIAARENHPVHKKSVLFYRNFLESVRRHGRVREMEFMTLYFLSLKNPFTPLQFTPLGLRLMGKGKVGIQVPSKGQRRLEALFRKAEELEEQE